VLDLVWRDGESWKDGSGRVADPEELTIVLALIGVREGKLPLKVGRREARSSLNVNLWSDG
jgi:hypothetical protein